MKVSELLSKKGAAVKVSELLSKKGAAVYTIKADSSIAAAIDDLAEHNIGALVVSSDGRTVEGIISERDVVRALHKFGSGVAAEVVASIMSSKIHTCAPGDTVESLVILMTKERIRHVPVVSDGVLAGMASIGDVVKSRMDELEQDREALIDYIGAR